MTDIAALLAAGMTPEEAALSAVLMKKVVKRLREKISELEAEPASAGRDERLGALRALLDRAGPR